jgi:PKD repeat protein
MMSEILMLGILIIGLPVICASAGTETLVSTGSQYPQLAPSTSGDYIVWEDQGAGISHILLLNLVSGEKLMISDPSSNAQRPRMQGTSVVWYEETAGGSDIYHYNITSGLKTRITDYEALKLNPVVYENKIVWQEAEASDDMMGTTYYDLQMYDLNNPGPIVNITPHTGEIPGFDDINHENPAIWGDYVVWRQFDDATYNVEIFMNDTATGTLTQVTDFGGFGYPKYMPAVSGTNVVWVDERNGDADIFYDTIPPTGNTDLTPYSPSFQFHPALFEDTVIWLDDRDHEGLYYQIGMNSLSSPLETYPLTPDSRLTGIDFLPAPSLFNSRVVWGDDRVYGGHSDIYMFTDGISVSCPVAGFSTDITSGSPPLPVQFSDGSSPAPSYWRWDFGDGTTSILQSPLHIFSTSGTYPVILTVGTPYCRNATSLTNAHNISVGAAPVVEFTASPREGMVPLTVSFTETSSGSPDSWNWSFGDGSFSDDQNPSHTYTTGGTYSVRCNATNAFGTGTLTRGSYITATAGAHEIAFTNISGIGVQTLGLRRFLLYDHTLLPDYVIAPDGAAFNSYPPLEYGWQNITFFSNDGIGFVSDAAASTGNVSSTNLTTRDILPAGFSSATGSTIRMNYRITLDGYQEPASLITDVWEGTTPSDTTNFELIAMRSNFASMYPAYTINTTRNNLSMLTGARINLSVGSSWLTGTQGLDWGRQHAYVIAMGYDSDGGLKGTVLPAIFMFNDTANHLEYFESEVPRDFVYLNKYALVKLSGSGNPFQLITLTVTSHANQQSSLSESSDSGTSTMGGGTGAAQVVVPTTAPAPTMTETPPDPGRSAKVYTNPQGVVTQLTRLESTDGLATMTLAEGVLAQDAGKNPLTEITIKAVPAGEMPAVPSGSAFTFAGMAYEIGPDGASFSPPLALTFTLPQAQWGRDYAVKMFDKVSGTWQDLPLTFDATTGTVTVQVSHLCCFALFTEPRASLATPATPAATPEPVPAAPQVTAQPPAGAVGTFTSMLGWITTDIVRTAVVVVGIVVLVLAVYLYRHGRFPGS